MTRSDLGRLGVPAATVRGWVHRGHLTRIGGTSHNPEYSAETALALVERWKPRGDPA
ncbi:hypothetical protein ACIQOW_08475 [Kitasatospora sp. NPDC091335]|uniref:hypothetical protein n=1 Tax=Kitasatospora sp. NPDC091335 TaxID=3364085 RepID=UPI003800CBA3